WARRWRSGSRRSGGRPGTWRLRWKRASRRRRSGRVPERENGAIRARAFWSGTISFGLVSIPVNLFAATRGRQVSLRMLAPEGTPLVRRYFDPETGKEVPRDRIVRGYEIEKGQFVVVTDEELSALEPDRTRDIDLR